MSFDPDWCISPGEILKDWMKENGLPLAVTAKACRLPVEVVHDILNGSRQLGELDAEGLQRGTHVSKSLWLNLERAYRDGLKLGKRAAT
jgi:plasmid maintenance system antidote protein VapI